MQHYLVKLMETKIYDVKNHTLMVFLLSCFTNTNNQYGTNNNQYGTNNKQSWRISNNLV